MSLNNYEIVRLRGQLTAYVTIQNDWTGQTLPSLRKIYDKEGEYFIRADGRTHNISKSVYRFLEHERMVAKAIMEYKSRR